jgi:hypothetical protein
MLFSEFDDDDYGGLQTPLRTEQQEERLKNRKDPHNGNFLAAFAAIIYSLAMLPWMSASVFLPYLMYLTWSNPYYVP